MIRDYKNFLNKIIEMTYQHFFMENGKVNTNIIKQRLATYLKLKTLDMMNYLKGYLRLR